MSFTLSEYYATPGMGTAAESTEIEFTWGTIGAWQIKAGVLDSTTVDARNTPTTTLSRGLVLGQITASGKLKEYDPTATDGSDVAVGILYDNVPMLNAAGTAVDRVCRYLWFGPVKATQLGGLDVLARRQLAGQIWFDDKPNQDTHVSRVVAKTADYTVTAEDNNTIFTTRGASGTVTFTLPTIARGLRYRFFNEADQNMVVASVVADTMVTFADLAADSIAFSTTSEKIGGAIEVIANDNASKWLVFVNLGAETQTPTIVTA
jgi:hypothetical protein